MSRISIRMRCFQSDCPPSAAPMRPHAMWSSLDLFWGVPAFLSKSALLREAAVLIEVPFLSKGALDLLQSRVVLPSVRLRRKYTRQAAPVNATSQQTLPRSVIGSSLRTSYPVAMCTGVLGEQAPKSHSRWSAAPVVMTPRTRPEVSGLARGLCVFL